MNKTRTLPIRGGRNQSIDLIKIYAMLGVLMLHVNVLPEYFNYPTYYVMTGLAGLAMPLFFMVSGYLLIGRPMQKSNYRYVGRKIYGIIRFVTLATLIYGLLITVVKQDKSEIFRTLHSLYGNYLQARNSNLGQFWYFGSMIIIYLIYPFINRLYHDHHRAYTNILLGLAVVCVTLFIEQYPNIEGYTMQPFRLWNWVLYFMLGGMIKEISFRPSLMLILLCGVAYTYLFYYFIECTRIYTAELMFSSPITIAYAALLFIYFTNISFNRPSYIITHLSQTFLPVYTIQWPIINQMWHHANFSASIGGVAPIVCWIVTSIVCVGLSLLIMMTKPGKWLFRI